MTDFLFAILFSPWLIAALAICAVYEDSVANRTRAGTMSTCAILVTSVLLKDSITLQGILIAVALWIPIGAIWSRFRWKAHVSSVMKEYVQEIKDNKSINNIDRAAERAKRELQYTRYISTISYWILFFPISILSELTGDILRGIEHLVTSTFRKLYSNIGDKAAVDVAVWQATEIAEVVKARAREREEAVATEREEREERAAKAAAIAKAAANAINIKYVITKKDPP